MEEIYAYGFRNPFRISFDTRGPSPTNKLYVADVGQDRNTFSREEVNDVVPGGNYGWVAKSGTLANNVTTTNGTITYSTSQTLLDPIAQYPTTQLNNPSLADSNGGLAGLGGFLYRGSLIPELQGKYVYGDFDRGTGSGRLLFTDPSDVSLQVFDIPLNASGLSIPSSQLHGVAQDANGEIYFLFNNGQVLGLVPEPSSAAVLCVGALIAACRRRRSRLVPSPLQGEGVGEGRSSWSNPT
jgi:glucose/arabinose dehydrogenase